ncbi:MAG: Ig-like domain-containing protein [Paludibacteraceae bacterium]|nr:Ig-like domain-containing protein [Paludibacteraceae bacterium]
MKHFLTSSFILCMACALMAQTPRVLSVQDLGKGFDPRISADGTEVMYLDNESDAYAESHASDLYVTNEDLNLNLYRGGERTVLNPRGNDVHYVWSSISPDGKRILFHTKYGTEICDLNGHILANLGVLIAPQWYGNDYVVGSTETSDGHQYLTSCIAIISADGTGYTALTRPEEMGMHPSVSPQTGRIAYATLDGDLRLLQLNLAEQPIQSSLPLVKRAPQAMRAPARAKSATYKQPSELRIYINPGHGGYDSDDRLMNLYPFKRGSEDNFWESKSNLDKGLHLRDLLNSFGVQNTMSRTTNTTADDLPLSTIVAEANAYNPDFFLSIHSNAGNPSNFILEIFAGKDLNDTRTYSTDYIDAQCSEESYAVTTLMGNILYENKVSDWTRQPMIKGNKTFAKDVMGWSNGYGVLRGLKVPGTISEGCMHDYIPETYRLMNMGYKWKEAFYFARTFLEYYCNYTIPVGGIGGQVRDYYLPMEFPAISYHKGTLDGQKPINRAKVELYQGGSLLQTCYTDTLYNGCYFFFDLQPGTYEVKVTADGYYDYSYKETVTAAHISYHNALVNMKRATPLEVIGYAPQVELTDSVDVSTNITLDFNWDCRKDSVEEAFSITPAVEGIITFEKDNRRMRFAPSGRFEPGTEYTVRLSTKACHADTTFKNHLQTPLEFRFRTKDRGAIRFLGSYPANGEKDVPLNPSFITLFDQAIVSSSARNSYVLKDMQGNEVKISTRSFKYNQAPEPNGFVSFETSSALQPSTEYELTVLGSLKDNLGVYLVNDLPIRFTTMAEEIVPDIPLYDLLDTLVFAVDKESSVNTSSLSTLRNTNTKYSESHKASNELTYAFADDADAEAHFKAKDPAYISTIGSADRLGMHVFSDFSGNTVYLRCEVAGDIQYVKLCDLDYGGWKWQEADLSSLPKGVEYQLMGIRVVRGTSLLSGKGSIYLNDLRYQYNPQTAVDNVDAEQPVPQKVLREGHLYIRRDGKIFDVEGLEVK